VPGVTARQLDRRATNVFHQHGLQQHVTTPTRGDPVSENILDLILTSDDQPSGQLVSEVTVHSVCFSDHRLVKCRLGVPTTPPTIVTYSYRSLRMIDITSFGRDILCSRLYDSSVADVDEFAELFDSEVERKLDIHAPLRSGRRRSGKNDTRQLSDEARRAKQLRRCLERRHRRTGLESDRRTYQAACTAARDSITKSRADQIKSQLDEVASDPRATWRRAQSVLHTNHKVVYNDVECATLVSTFCRFFVDKVDRIHDNIVSALQSMERRVFTGRPHFGELLSSFQPVSTKEVRRLLTTMPSKSSPLDVLPCSPLKSRADIFVPVIARLANLSMQAGQFPSRYKQAQVLPLLKKAGLDSSLPGNYRPISNLSTISKVLKRLVLTRLRPHLLASPNFNQYQSAYRREHSTETALLEVLDGVYTAADNRQV